MYFYSGKVLPSQLADIVQSLTDKSDVFLFGRSVIDRGPVRIRSFTHARDSAWRQTVAQIWGIPTFFSSVVALVSISTAQTTIY